MVTTTGILADLVRNVAGDRATVTQMVPDGADPHSYEPGLRTVRDVAYADLAFSNYLLLEEHAIIRTLDANLPRGAVSVSIAEEASKEGATILPLVEDRALEAVWLGMRVAGTGSRYGADRASQVDLSVTGVEGPGDASAYLTTTFGAPEVGFTSSDGFDAGDGYRQDTSTLPADAHQHMSWAFTAPGVYRVHLSASLRTRAGARPVPVGETTAVFAVGVDPAQVAAAEGRQVLEAGHADVTVDLEAGAVDLMVDTGVLADAGGAGAPGGSGASGGPGERSPVPATGPDPASPSPVAGPTPATGPAPASPAPAGPSPASPARSASVPGLEARSLDDVVISVPSRTLAEVPATSGYRFLGTPGSQVYLLPQAVLGKHVHGEIDPHLWHDAHNAAAYVRVIRDRLIQVDPGGEATYRANAASYLARLDQVDAEVSSTISTIPPERRQLVTTNDAYAYLAHAYGLSVAGFVAPNPATEPSLADRRRLAATLADLHVPAVFLEPNLSRTRSTLRTVAAEAGVQVCPLYGDTLDEGAPTYLDMMRFNANSLARCLGGTPGG